MSNGVMLVWSNPDSPENDAAYNEWYNTTHISDMTAGGDCERVTRYKMPDGETMDGYRYLAVYEFDDMDAWFAGRATAPKSTPGPLDPNTRRFKLERLHEYVKPDRAI